MIPRHFQITVALLLVGVLAAGVYIFDLRRREKAKSRPDTSARQLTAPVVGRLEKVQLMIAYDDDGVLAKREASLALPIESGARVKELVRALLVLYAEQPSPHGIDEGADVKNVFIVADNLCVIDLNGAFAEKHRSGIMLEQFTIASIVETIGLNVPGITRVKFLIEGQERETLAGHADLSTIYETGQIHQLIAEMQQTN
jgi:hypothetical protein